MENKRGIVEAMMKEYPEAFKTEKQVRDTVDELIEKGWMIDNGLYGLSITPKGVEEMEKRMLIDDVDE